MLVKDVGFLGILNKKMGNKKKLGITWEGYEFSRGSKNLVYSKHMTYERFRELMTLFRSFHGSQQEFYFRFVNPLRTVRIRKQGRGRNQKHGKNGRFLEVQNGN